MEERNKKIIKKLFKEAKNHSSIQYVFTLLKVWGLDSFEKEPMLELYDFLKASRDKINNADKKELQIYLKRIFSAYPVYSVVWNLIHIKAGGKYQVNPFDITFPNSKRTDFDSNFYLTKLHEKVKKNGSDLYNLLTEVFSSDVFGDQLIQVSSIDLNSYKENIDAAFSFFIDFIEIYLAKLKSFNDKRVGKLQKLPGPNFEVIELLINDEQGLFGFVIYHSNGSKSTFKRLKKRVEVINLTIDDQIGVMVGDLDALKPIWMVEGKPLYEMGLPGRYNAIGEWKPLEYPGDPLLIETKARELTKDKKDKRITGCLFYIMIT